MQRRRFSHRGRRPNEQFGRGWGYSPPVFIITGGRGEGKTTTLGRVMDILRDEGLNTAGIITPGTVKDGIRDSFTVVDLKTGRGVLLCSRDPDAERDSYGVFLFSPEGLEHGLQALSPESAKGADIILIDEIGHFELRGECWAGSIDRLTATAHKPMIWVVRKRSLEQIIARWKLLNPVILDITEYNADEIANMAIKNLKPNGDIYEM